MKTKICLYIIIFIFSLFSNCAPPDRIQPNIRDLIVNNWQFVSIEVNETETKIGVSDGFDPGQYFVPWFWFSYNSDMSYEFRSDVIDGFHISYGYEYNYQPDYGYWEIVEDQQLLIHNKGMPYEKRYRIIELQDTLFIREYERIIYQLSQTSDPIWHIGDTVTYRETLRKRRGPCCNN